LKYNFIDSTIALNLAFFCKCSHFNFGGRYFLQKWLVRSGRNSRCTPIIRTNVRHTMGACIIRHCANSCRTKFYNYWNFSGSNYYGRLFEFTDSTLGSTHYNAIDSHCTSRDCNFYFWRKRNRKNADFQSGNFEFAIGFCHYPSDSFC